jgi:two-component system response regulator PilR (NtrC family)
VSARVLVAEDDAVLRSLVCERLRSRGDVASPASTLAEARARLRQERPDAVLVATTLPDGAGSALLPELDGPLPVPCVMMAPGGAVLDALDALGRGADDYVEKPFTLERLETTLDGALERARLRREIRALRAHLEEDVEPRGELLGLGDALDRVERLAPAADASVLLVGEPGTGKRLLARFIHRLSPRSRGPFVSCDGSAREGGDAEIALFGREAPGSAAGASTCRGLVELARGGTLYLERIAALPLAVQDRVLRLLDTRGFRPVGGPTEREADVRVVASCTRPPGLEVAEGRLREGLHDRLALLRIQLRPLRHRPAEVPGLAQAFLRRSAVELGRPARHIGPAAMTRLQDHGWPGNLRELRNVVEGAVLRCEGEEITPEHLPEALRVQGPRRVPGGVRLGSSGLDLEELERGLVLEALRRTDGNRTEAGRLLGLSRHQIRNRLKKYGVER